MEKKTVSLSIIIVILVLDPKIVSIYMDRPCPDGSKTPVCYSHGTGNKFLRPHPDMDRPYPDNSKKE